MFTQTNPPAIYQLWFRFSYPDTGFHNVFCLWVSALVTCNDPYLPVSLSSFGGTNIPCVLPSPMNPIKVDFSVCLAFYLLLGWSGNFQTSYTWNQKPEVPTYHLNRLIIVQPSVTAFHRFVVADLKEISQLFNSAMCLIQQECLSSRVKRAWPKVHTHKKITQFFYTCFSLI